MGTICRRCAYCCVFTLGVLLVGCSGGKSSAEYKDMAQMAEKIRVKVKSYVSDLNLSGANELAIASVLFAREMQCASGERKPESFEVSSSTRGGGELQVMDTSEARARCEKFTQRVTLNADEGVAKMRLGDYDAILGWALTAEDLARLREIRTKCGYWAPFRDRMLSST